ncbi:hypothetical protein P775_11300 [Puniceibacterium antarcticum]|uniref:Uncharacterized protein n=1 Tax=Puniceibacterium antarcticum TaxID=1206336 RepID=A0A2G8RF87_9RHOB|nr:hypothetical protein [Puniceibacterium antarcticum]PIL20061.1 hypothetical protein P775_11300 [Puniceibacterium antarcticum]
MSPLITFELRRRTLLIGTAVDAISATYADRSMAQDAKVITAGATAIPK